MSSKYGEQKSPDLPAMSSRVREVLDRQFDGNAKAMSQALGIPYLSLIRTIHGSDPSSRLLTALVDHAQVDAQWLLTGRTIQGRDFGLSGNVRFLPICPAPLAARSIGERIPVEWPRQPVATTHPMREAYCFTISAGDEILTEKSFRVSAGDMLIIECAEDGEQSTWNGSWVTFLERSGTRVRLGFLDSEKLIRTAGVTKPRFRLGPDREGGEGSGLFQPRKRSATRYGIEVDGITPIFCDHVLGRAVAKICWRNHFQTVEAIGAIT